MDAPEKEPASRWLRGLGEVGKGIELMFVQRFGAFGVLLTADQTAGDEYQTIIIDEDHWLTCAPDAFVVPEGWDRPHAVEIKGKALDVVKSMQRLERGPDPKHIAQVKTQISMAHANHADLFGRPDLSPCEDGSIFYFARDDPAVTFEFSFSRDDRFYQAGLKQLKKWQGAFLRGELPPHPFGGREWSQEPCKFCPFKKHICKPDELAGIDKLRDSHAIEFATEVRDVYDYDQQRASVLERWKVEDLEER
jgi:hypothetical protein